MSIKILFFIMASLFFNHVQAAAHKTPKTKNNRWGTSKPKEPKKPASEIKIGSPAPDFSLPDQTGKIHKLAEYRGWKVALCFYPKDHTRGCIEQMCSLRNGWEKLQARGVTILGINFDSQAMHSKFAQDQKLNFPLLSDEHKEIGTAYKVKEWLTPNPKRMTYIIDEKGNILSIIDKVNTKEHANQILDHITAPSKSSTTPLVATPPATTPPAKTPPPATPVVKK